MTSVAHTLCAIEARAERAIVHELRLMMLDVLSLRTQLQPDERGHADSLLLKLDRLEHEQTAGRVPPLPPKQSLGKAYKILFYNQDCGDLRDALTVDSFDASVQLVHDRLPPETAHVVRAQWNCARGDMAVCTPRGTVVARIEPADDTPVAVRPTLAAACTALKSGDTEPLQQLFGPAPEPEAI